MPNEHLVVPEEFGNLTYSRLRFLEKRKTIMKFVFFWSFKNVIINEKSRSIITKM